MSTHRHYPRRFQTRSRIRGMSLVELMISMVIGMVVVASASAIFISNRQTYRATESMARLQEGGRVSFEMMSRDIRQAAGNPCAQDLPAANVLNNAAANWWSNWTNAIIGYEENDGGAFPFAAGIGGRVNGTDAIELKSADNISGVTVVNHNAVAASFEVNTPNHPLDDGDIILVCDFLQSTVLQVTNASPGVNPTIVHNDGAGAPGNCSKGLGFPTNCGPGVGTPHTYGPGSTIVKVQASRWYIGNNETGGRSLFRTVLTNVGGAATRNEEIVGGVNDMRLQYLQRNTGNYVDAAAVGNWGNVVAVRVLLTMAGGDRIGTDGNPIQRNLAHTVTLRNRMQ
ncbi:MAG: PilW family protein [Xanthomonadaceae bacterium]|nr:PilW family protein [Xanthomonadaceae bacterium]